MATCAEVVGYELAGNEGEDSYNMLAAFQTDAENSSRKDIIHHSINGEFALRKGDCKLITCAGLGGWSYPTKKDVNKLDSLPSIQLYNLKNDPGETNNLQADRPEEVAELSKLLSQYILSGRSTEGENQSIDPFEGEWSQIDFVAKVRR